MNTLEQEKKVSTGQTIKSNRHYGNRNGCELNLNCSVDHVLNFFLQCSWRTNVQQDLAKMRAILKGGK